MVPGGRSSATTVRMRATRRVPVFVTVTRLDVGERPPRGKGLVRRELPKSEVGCKYLADTGLAKDNPGYRRRMRRPRAQGPRHEAGTVSCETMATCLPGARKTNGCQGASSPDRVPCMAWKQGAEGPLTSHGMWHVTCDHTSFHGAEPIGLHGDPVPWHRLNRHHIGRAGTTRYNMRRS